MNAFLDNGFCQDELNHGDCMFDGLDCCGYDWNYDGNYDYNIGEMCKDCAVTITQPFGVITSPRFPQPYPNGVDCTWNIQLQMGQLIQFNFLHFDVQLSPSCWVDSLRIYDGGSNTSPMLGNPSCGDSLPPSQISSSNQLFFHFFSDMFTTGTGFQLKYNVTSCDNVAMVGNGFCNDEANIAACNYDGGDCCGHNLNTDHCYQCHCFNKETCEAGVANTYVGDGYCDDETNIAACSYDGGDCCGSCVNTEHCSNCDCLGGLTSAGITNPLVGNGLCNEETNNIECDYDGGDCCGPDVSCCEIPQIHGDGYCDDVNNNYVCFFDGGDCCGSNVNTNWCTECPCLELGGGGTTTSGSTNSGGCNQGLIANGYCDDVNNNLDCTFDGGDCCGPDVSCCENPGYHGDLMCDDVNNNEACFFDGGDCCGSNVNTAACTECLCLELGGGGPDISSCEIPGYHGDGVCDDVNNNEACFFDGGDCCGSNVNTQFCTECLCLEGGGGSSGGITTPSGTTTSGCFYQQWVGDGYCDDSTNNLDCTYDGGDCCGPNVNTQYCFECICYE